LKNKSPKTPSISSTSERQRSIKLPTIELPKFDGNPIQWQSFWDQFNSAIHHNESLTEIDIFNYLKRYVVGNASGTISGLELTTKNYNEAIELLTSRFGNQQVLVNAHMETFLKLEKVRTLENTR